VLNYCLPYFTGMNSFEDVLTTFKRCKQDLGEILSSCEYIDNSAMQCVTQNLNLKVPIEDFSFFMLIETSGSNQAHDEEKLNVFLEKIMADGTVSDGTIASGPGLMLVNKLE
jgi:D-2-hydroxyglutarate dehydrogenase